MKIGDLIRKKHYGNHQKDRMQLNIMKSSANSNQYKSDIRRLRELGINNRSNIEIIIANKHNTLIRINNTSVFAVGNELMPFINKMRCSS